MFEIALIVDASGGLGRAFCDALRSMNTQVIVAGRNQDNLRELVQSGAAIRSLRCDLTDPGAADHLAAKAGQVDLVIIAAGCVEAGAFLERDWAERQKEIAVNCLSVAQIVHVFGKRMMAAGRGHIILIGSTAAARPAPGLAAYAASKAFLNAFAQALAAEWNAKGVRITCCLTGPMATEFSQRAGLKPGWYSRDPAKVAAAALAASYRGQTGQVFSDAGAWLRTRLFESAPRSLLAWLAPNSEKGRR